MQAVQLQAGLAASVAALAAVITRDCAVHGKGCLQASTKQGVYSQLYSQLSCHLCCEGAAQGMAVIKRMCV